MYRRSSLRAVAIAIALSAAVPAAAAAGDARPLSADRPDRTESPYSVPPGHLQIECDFASMAFTRRDGAESRAADLGAVNLKIGLHPDLDVQFVSTVYSHARLQPEGLPATSDGVGFPAVGARAKWNLAGNDGGRLAIGVLPYVELAREGDADPVVGALVPVALDLPAGLGFGAMSGFEDAGNAGSAWIASATVGRELAPRLGVFVEGYAAWNWSGGPGAVLESTFDWGITFAARERLQLDAGARHGLGGAAEDVRGFVGLTWRGRP